MPLPSLWVSGEHAQEWRPTRAAAYGAGIGLAAALFKLLGPSSEAHSTAAVIRECAGAAAAFAILCGTAAMLRNFIARRLIWPESR